MKYAYFSRNGTVLPIDQAVVPLDDIAYAYGFGVYETIRLHAGIAYFAANHWQRLHTSAAAINLEHVFTTEFLESSLAALIAANNATDGNIKILLIGGRTAVDAVVTMQLLNPLYPDRKLYRDGATAITIPMERAYPQAKTLNMLPSYLAYREAQAAGAYDAILINRQGQLSEGTRTNFFAMRGKTIYGAPAPTILPGVMRQAVLAVAVQNGYTVVEEAVSAEHLAEYDAAFVTSTSSKIMPLRVVDTHQFTEISPALQELMAVFQAFYDNCQGQIGEVH